MKRFILTLILGISMTTAALAQMSVKDSQNNVLAQFYDEGTWGSFFLPQGSTPGSISNKLYNIGGTLYWNGSQIQTGVAAGDNLGDHKATQNIQLNGHWLSRNSSNKGIFIDSQHRVGIGNINNPATTLHVWGDPGNMLNTQDGVLIGRGNSGGARIKISEHNTGSVRAPKLDFATDDPDFNLRLSYHNIDGFSIRSKRDDIVRFTNDAVSGAAGNGTGLTIRYLSASAAAARPFSTNSQNVEIDNTAGGGLHFMSNGQEMARVQFNGTFRPRENPTGSYEANLGKGDKRWGTVYTVNGIDQLSDRRAKSNIQGLGYGLNEVMQLRPVSYTYIDQEAGGKKLGFVAQEVQNVVSEAVSVGNDPKKMLGMNYIELIPVLIKAMQEQQAEIEALKKALNH